MLILPRAPAGISVVQQSMADWRPGDWHLLVVTWDRSGVEFSVEAAQPSRTTLKTPLPTRHWRLAGLRSRGERGRVRLRRIPGPRHPYLPCRNSPALRRRNEDALNPETSPHLDGNVPVQRTEAVAAVSRPLGLSMPRSAGPRPTDGVLDSRSPISPPPMSTAGDDGLPGLGVPECRLPLRRLTEHGPGEHHHVGLCRRACLPAAARHGRRRAAPSAPGLAFTTWR